MGKVSVVARAKGQVSRLDVDTAQCKLVVPQDKVGRIKSSIRELLQRQQATSRELACVAGMLNVSFARIVHGTFVSKKFVSDNGAW